MTRPSEETEQATSPLPTNPYEPIDFDLNEETGEITLVNGDAVKGIDVSEWQGKIDWEEVKDSGVLCVITEKQGSAPRGVGSMMFVGENEVLGSIGGGEPEYQAIRHAKENPVFSIQQYTLNRAAANGLDMICGGSISVVFIPVA